MLGKRQDAVAVSRAALAALALVLSGCASAHQHSSISGRAKLYGNVPGGGKPLTVGAVRDGSLLATAKIRPTGSRFDLPVSPGRYQVGLWLPDARQLLPKRMICAARTKVRVTLGQEAAVTLTCFWH